MSRDIAGGVLHFVKLRAARGGIDVGGREIGFDRGHRPRAARGGIDIGGREIGHFQVRHGSVGNDRRLFVVLDVVSIRWVCVELSHPFDALVLGEQSQCPGYRALLTGNESLTADA